jgi:hypothetical protein
MKKSDIENKYSALRNTAFAGLRTSACRHVQQGRDELFLTTGGSVETRMKANHRDTWGNGSVIQGGRKEEEGKKAWWGKPARRSDEEDFDWWLPPGYMAI